jgi:hypothetical protein
MKSRAAAHPYYPDQVVGVFFEFIVNINYFPESKNNS